LKGFSVIEPVQLKVFLTVASTSSFALAAKELHISASSISKIVAALEASVEQQLFVRTTRRVALTPQGQEFIPLARRSIESLRDAENFFHAQDSAVKSAGVIRITCPYSIGSRKIADVSVKFGDLYPDIELEFILTDERLNIIDSDMDMAIRVLRSPEPSYISRKLFHNDIVIGASEAYLLRYGSPRSVADLDQHRLLYIEPHGALTFRDANLRLKDLGKAINKRGTSNGDFLVEFAASGGGIVFRPAWGIEREIEQGRLVKVDIGDTLISDSGVYAVYPERDYIPKRVKLWIDFLVSECPLKK
jgi:DNA-binding transcriptional LysR family regulator